MPCAVVDHTPNTAAAAGRSVTVGAPKASEPAVASAPPTLRKAASAVEGGDVTAPSVAPPKPPPASSSAGAPDRAGAAKKVPAKPAKTSSFFGGFAAQVAAGKSALEKVQAASPVASLPSSPPPASEAPPAPVAAPKDSGSDSDDAEFGAGLVPSKPSNSTSASKPAALASKIKSTVTPPAKAQPPAKAPAPVAMSDEEEEEEEEMDVPPEADLLPSVDLNASVEPQAEVAVADPVSSAPVVLGKTMKKVLRWRTDVSLDGVCHFLCRAQVLKERTFENEDGFLGTCVVACACLFTWYPPTIYQ